MGFTCPLTEHASFVYRAEDEGRGVEHEYDTILVGMVDDVDVQPNPDEVTDWAWLTIEELGAEMERAPENFAPWFPLALSYLLTCQIDEE